MATTIQTPPKRRALLIWMIVITVLDAIALAALYVLLQTDTFSKLLGGLLAVPVLPISGVLLVAGATLVIVNLVLRPKPRPAIVWICGAVYVIHVGAIVVSSIVLYVIDN